ncbi:MAG: hypothetical protein JWM80_5097 [Cyanobacteria bacterium RYN_339]|nr:hypothetical protein [Cyanobacteria bacterium RYN_339]
MGGGIGASNQAEQARKLAEEAMKRIAAERAKKKAEADALQQQQANQQKQETKVETPEPKPEDTKITFEEFKADPELRKQLNVKDDQLKATFDKLAAGDDDKGTLSAKELNNAFLEATPAEAPETKETKEPAESKVGETVDTTKEVADKVAEQFEKTINDPKISPELKIALKSSFDRYKGAMAKADALTKGADPATALKDPEVLSQLSKSSAQLLGLLAKGAKTSSAALGAATAIGKGLASFANAAKSVAGKAEDVAGRLGKLGSLGKAFTALEGLATGQQDGKPLDPASAFQLASDMKTSLQEFVSTEGGKGEGITEDALGALKELTEDTAGTIGKIAETAGTTPVKNGLLKKADDIFKGFCKQAEKLGVAVDKYLEKAYTKALSVVGKLVGEAGSKLLDAALTRVAEIAGGPVSIGVDVALMELDFMKGQYIDGVQGIGSALVKGRYDTPPDKSFGEIAEKRDLLAQCEENLSVMKDQLAPKGPVSQAQYDDANKRTAELADKVITGVDGSLGINRYYGNKDMLREKLQTSLNGQKVNVEGKGEVDAGQLFARRDGKLSPEEKRALAPLVAKQGLEVLGKSALNDGVVPTKLPLEGLTPDMVANMPPLSHAEFIQNLDPAQMDKIPFETRQKLLDVDTKERNTAQRVVQNLSDGALPMEGKLLASMLRTGAPGNSPTRTEMLTQGQGQESYINKDNLLHETVKNMEPADLAKLDTATLQELGTGVASRLWTSSADKEVATKVMGALLEKGLGNPPADATAKAAADKMLEGYPLGERADIYAKGLKQVSPETIAKMDPADRLATIDRMVGPSRPAYPPATKDQLAAAALLVRAQVEGAPATDKEAALKEAMSKVQFRETDPPPMRTDLAHQEDTMLAAVARSYDPASEADRKTLAGLPPAMVERMGTASAKAGTDEDLARAVMATNALRGDGSDPQRVDAAERVLAKANESGILGTAKDNVAAHRIDQMTPEQLKNLPEGERNALLKAEDYGLRSNDQNVGAVTKLLKAAQDDPKLAGEILDKLSPEMRAYATKKLIDDAAPGELKKLPAAVQTRLAEEISKAPKIDRWPSFAGADPIAASAGKLMAEVPKAVQDQLGATVHDAMKAAGSVSAFQTSRLGTLAENDPAAYREELTNDEHAQELVRDLDNHILGSDPADSAIALLMQTKLRAVALTPEEEASCKTPKERKALLYQKENETFNGLFDQLNNNLIGGTRDNISEKLVGGMTPFDMRTTMPKEMLVRLRDAHPSGNAYDNLGEALRYY